MLLHVIWGFADEAVQECPTFSVTGVMLQCSDRSAAHVRQGRFRWRDEAWEAEVEITGSGATRIQVPGVLRLRPEVFNSWNSRALNPRTEAARQLREAMQHRGWSGHLGVVTLTS